MHAVKQQVFAGLADDAGNPSGRDCSPGKFEDTVLEAALAMRWSEWMVHDRMETGKEIVDRLPDTWQALARGEIDYWQASRLAKATRKLEDNDKAALLEQRVLAKAPTHNHAETGKLIDRELIKADAEAAEKRRKKARWWRRVTRSRDEDGMASLHVHGPVEDIATIDIALSRGADLLKTTGQVETMDQGRFDTAVSLATDFFRNQFVPTKSGRPTALNLITKGLNARR
jgi:hypothetical protein